jgi:hypothetical protein
VTPHGTFVLRSATDTGTGCADLHFKGTARLLVHKIAQGLESRTSTLLELSRLGQIHLENAYPRTARCALR